MIQKQLLQFLAIFAMLYSSMVTALPKDFDTGMNALLEGNYAEAYCLWKPLAKRGYAEAQYNLGWLYANGNGMNVDLDIATHWWKSAADQGHADSQFAMGLAYTTGEGIKKNLIAATAWFLQAAKQGHLDAREILARLSSDPRINLLASNPDLLKEEWFGWQGLSKGKRINARNSPSKKGKIIAQLVHDTPLRVVGRSGNWLQAVSASAKGSRVIWIYHTLIRVKPAT